MTPGALNRCVCSGQGEFRRRAVIEPGALPSPHRVARFAAGRKPHRNVVHCFRRVVVFQMTRGAGRAQSGVCSGCRSFVTGFALDSAMSSGQRKAIFVLPRRLGPDGPALFVMAVVAG